MRPADPLALVVIGHAAFLAAVDLHVGGVQVDRDRPVGQRRRPRRGQQRQHPPRHRRQATLHRLPLRGGDPPGQARRGGGRQPRHRGDLLPGRIGALAVQPGQEVLPGQLRRRDPGQQLPGPETAIPLLDRADRRIQRPDHAEPVTQLGDRGQPRVRRQRRIRRADPHLLTPPAASTYPAHQIGVLSAGLIITWQRSSSQARAAPIGICRAVSPAYSRIRVRELVQRNVIDVRLLEWADGLRVLGNVGAHFTDQVVTRQDASDALDLIEAMLDYEAYAKLQGAQ